MTNETPTLLSAALDTVVPLANMSPDEQLRALWRREGICGHYSEEKRRFMIAEASNYRTQNNDGD